MSMKLILGPILGMESNTVYSLLFVSSDAIKEAKVEYGGKQVKAEAIGGLEMGKVWLAELSLNLVNESQTIPYSITCDSQQALSQMGQSEWSFYLPGKTEKPRFAFGSCNGFSDYKLMNTTEEPFGLWKKMCKAHREAPFAALLMGGDQVYADSIWSMVSSLNEWNELNIRKRIEQKCTKRMKVQIEKFYSNLYATRWNQPEMALMLASIPSIMMWDDHDIFDGWGSYPEDLMKSEVYQNIFAVAKKHFELLQIRGRRNTALICKKSRLSYYSMYLEYRGYHILALDNRSERSLTQIMSSEHWQDIRQILENCSKGDLLVMTAVPVVYRDFAAAETFVDATPWDEEVTDDLKDHWRAKEHQGERQRLIMRLLDNAEKRKGKTVLLSGDVHVGCLGVIRDKRANKNTNIHQVVSSGIVHPAPTYMQWLGILAITNDDTEYLDENGSITADVLKPYGSNKYIRARNFVTLKEGTDQKLWVNWVTENKDKPVYPLFTQ